MDEVYPWLSRLLQVSDSGFPTGNYAHSYGFEQIVRLGLVHDEASIARYLQDHVWPNLVYFELPVVRFAQEAARNGDEAALFSLDVCVEATRSAKEAREASRATGRQRLRALQDTAESTLLTAFARAEKEGSTPAHHAVVYGIGMASVPQRALLTSWAFQSLSSVCLSAPKLLRVGQHAAQRALTHSLTHLEKNVELSTAIGRDDLGWFDPLMEIASMQHEIAYERLFIS